MLNNLYQDLPVHQEDQENLKQERQVLLYKTYKYTINHIN